MTTIPVLWISRHPEILARGYYDQALLEGIFARSVWSPPNATEFEHHEVRQDIWPDVDGAVTMLPARHHASKEDVRWFCEQVEKLEWSVVILCGDEAWDFDWRAVPETETRRVWIMQPRPEHSHLFGVPAGPYPGCHELLDGDYPERLFDWMFAGQVTHQRRVDCVKALKTLDSDTGMLHETEGYLQGMPKESYFQFMRMAKVVPCPSGPMTVDTARAFEAMEAGCVPLVDMVTPRGEDYDYWELLMQDGGLIPRITDWSTFPAVLTSITKNWTVLSSRVFAFWQSYKRRVSRRLDSDINEVRAAAGYTSEPSTQPDDLISVILTTSPTTLHPDTSHVEEVISSIRSRLPLAEIIIVFDGVRPEDESRRAAYQEYTNRLLWLCNYRYHNVVPIVCDEWGHQANAVRAALELVTTPYMLFIEHDTPLIGDIDWVTVINELRTGANIVRFHFDVTIHPDHVHLFGQPRDGFIPTFVWWQRPHLADTSFYRYVLARHFPPSSRTMIEDKMHSVVDCDRQDFGWDAWRNWRILTYAPEDNIKRSGHLDSRGPDVPKYRMAFQ